jgi:hypothetical protein
MIELIAAAGMGLYKGAKAYTEAKDLNNQIEYKRNLVDESSQLQLSILALQQKQMRAAATQEIIQRKVQGTKTLGARQAVGTASGLAGGGTLAALLKETEQNTSNDVGIIQSNLENAVVMNILQQGQVDVERRAALSELQNQKVNPWEKAIAAGIQGAIQGYQLGGQVVAGIDALKNLNMFGAVSAVGTAGGTAAMAGGTGTAVATALTM